MKGTTNAMRGEFAKPIVVELLDTTPLVIPISFVSMKDKSQVYGYTRKSVKEVFSDDLYNLLVSTRYTWTVNTGYWSPREVTARFGVASVDLTGKYSTNLPAGSIILIKLTRSAYANIDEEFTPTCEATIGQNGEITMELDQTASFKFWDEKKSSYSNVTLLPEVIGVKQIGNGGGTN